MMKIIYSKVLNIVSSTKIILHRPAFNLLHNLTLTNIFNCVFHNLNFEASIILLVHILLILCFIIYSLPPLFFFFAYAPSQVQDVILEVTFIFLQDLCFHKISLFLLTIVGSWYRVRHSAWTGNLHRILYLESKSGRYGNRRAGVMFHIRKRRTA